MRWISGFILAAVACGQQVDLSHLDKIAARAKSSININFDEDKLKFASGFLATDEPNQSAAKNLVAGLKSINVRVFEFDKAGEFAASDLEAIRKQLKDPGWSKVVETKERDESVEIYMFGKNKDLTGLLIMASEKAELTVVNIVGPIDLKTLGALGGKFGIPKDVLGNGIPQPAPKRED